MTCLKDNGPISHWIKYNIYKPIRSLSEGIRYGYWMSQEAQEKQKREWIMGLKK